MAQEEKFLDWSDDKDTEVPAAAAAEGAWSQVKLLMRNIAAKDSQGTVSVDFVNNELGGLLSQGWQLFTAEVIRSTDTSFAMVFLLVRNNE